MEQCEVRWGRGAILLDLRIVVGLLPVHIIAAPDWALVVRVQVDLVQERIAEENAADGEDGMQEEGGEEENLEEDEELPASSVGGRSGMKATAAPATALGSLAEAAPRKVNKRKKAEVMQIDSDLEPEVEIIELDENQGADPDIMQIPRLRMIVNNLNQTCLCFSGLIPQKILYAKEKPGRQLRGAGPGK